MTSKRSTDQVQQGRSQACHPTTPLLSLLFTVINRKRSTEFFTAQIRGEIRKRKSTKINTWREVQNDGQQTGAEHQWKESFVGKKKDLQRQVFKGARSCHTSRKRRNT